MQSSVFNLIVDFEKEIQAFIPEAYYQIAAHYNEFKLSLVEDKLKILKIKDKEDAAMLYDGLDKQMICQNIISKETKRESKPALITSTLQQEASIKYGFSSDRTMRAAQNLYEGKNIGTAHVGLITYMRSDSTRLSDLFVKVESVYIIKNYGKHYLGSVKNKNRKGNVQDAHEAIRPTSLARTPQEMDQYLTADERKIYRLIYNRTISSLMSSAKFESTTMVFDCGGYPFKMIGQRMLFDGFLKVYGLTDED